MSPKSHSMTSLVSAHTGPGVRKSPGTKSEETAGKARATRILNTLRKAAGIYNKEQGPA